MIFKRKLLLKCKQDIRLLMIGEGLLCALEANLINALNNEDSVAKC